MGHCCFHAVIFTAQRYASAVYAVVVCFLNFIVKSERVLTVTGSHVYFKSGSIWKTMLDRDIVTTGH